MTRKAFVALGALGIFCFTTDARAAGFALDVHSARPTGMATAVTGFIDDSSAIFYNPAGIARGKILDAQVGATLILPSFSYTNRSGQSTSTEFRVVPPVNAYVSGGITDDLSVGLGFFSPFGSTLSWPDGWEGRRQITDISIQTFFLNPTVAYRFGPVRIGAGFQLVRSTVRLQRRLAFGEREGGVDLGGATWGFGGNIGAQVDAIPKRLHFGIHYRSAVKLNYDGLADFDNVPEPLANAIQDQPVSTSLLTPDILSMGAAFRPVPSLLLAADVVWYGWANFRSVDLNFPEDAGGTLSNSRPKRWSNIANYHIGAEGEVTTAWRVRGGLVYDPTPSPGDTLTPESPDANRINFAVGGSYVHTSGVHVDVGYRLVILLKRESTARELPGDYQGTANLLGLTVGYRTPSIP